VAALYNKGLAFSNLKQYEDAIKWYDKALEVEPRNISILQDKALTLFKIGKYLESLCICEKLLKKNKDNTKLLDTKNNILKRLKMLEIMKSKGPLTYSKLRVLSGFKSKNESHDFAIIMRSLLRQSLIRLIISEKKYEITNQGKIQIKKSQSKAKSS